MREPRTGRWYGPIRNVPGALLDYELLVELSRRALTPDEWDAWLLSKPWIVEDRERLIDVRED